jgi:hypothetical protein
MYSMQTNEETLIYTRGLVMCYIKMTVYSFQIPPPLLTFLPLYLECSPYPTPPQKSYQSLWLIPKATSSTVQSSSIYSS